MDKKTKSATVTKILDRLKAFPDEDKGNLRACKEFEVIAPLILSGTTPSSPTPVQNP